MEIKATSAFDLKLKLKLKLRLAILKHTNAIQNLSNFFNQILITVLYANKMSLVSSRVGESRGTLEPGSHEILRSHIKF